ncbi:MAG: hypothetical protein ABR583_14680 [Gaiellaceae bacterium]
MRRFYALAATLATAALLLPGSGRPMPAAQRSFAIADPVTVTKTAPANATVGDLFDYTITLTYTGELTSPSAEYTVTDPLPPEVVFEGHGLTQGTCTTPAYDQGGTVSCAFRFTPQLKTIHITITVGAAAAGTPTNTAQLSTGPSATASTAIAAGSGPKPTSYAYPAPAGSVSVATTGPETIRMNPCCVPARFGYTLVMTYNGPTLGPRGVRGRFTDRLPDQVMNPGMPTGTEGVSDCVFTEPGVPAPVVSCNISFLEQQRTRTISIEVRPTGKAGVGTNTVGLSTGGTATSMTTFIREEAPKPPVHVPDPIPGPPAAPPKTITATFEKDGQTKSQAIALAPATKTAQIALSWPDADSSFNVTAIQLIPAKPGPAPARTFSALGALAPEKLKPRRLRISKVWTQTSLNVTVKGVVRGRLKYKIVATELEKKTRITGKIRQSKRG